MTNVVKKRPVSTSEVLDWNKCQTAWKYKYHPDYKLAPKTDGAAATLGIQGHKALEYFYEKLMEGVEYETVAQDVCHRLAMASVEVIAKQGDAQMAAMYSDLAVRLREYFDFYKSDVDNWEILAVEYKVETDDFVGRVDLIIRYKRGPFARHVAIVDHKFVYNFWNDKEYEMAPQPPNYIRAARIMHPEWTITHMVMNEIRYRMDAKEDKKFHRHNREPDRMEIEAFNDNHQKVSAQILEMDKLPRHEVDELTTRSLVKTTCGFCQFSSLCKAQMRKLDTTAMEAVKFKPNTYGYSSDE